jgi:hypothetical protein
MPTRSVRVGKIARDTSASGGSSAYDFAHPTRLVCRRIERRLLADRD